MTWFAVVAGIVAVWVGLGLYCAETFMGQRHAAPRRSPAFRERERHTPIPSPRHAD